MGVLRRIAALTVVAVVGIALLAPLAARSSVDVAVPSDDRLLEPASRRLEAAAAPRGLLVARELAIPARSADASAEVLRESSLPAPASAPMTATIVTIPVAAPASAPAPAPAAPAAPVVPDGSVWDALAECESGGNWSINTGNGYYGGLQFSYGTWHDYGGGEFAEYPHQATREQQIIVAERLRAARGYQPWPACRAKLGLP
jgi:resuscitation-promoting factor RpfB